MVQVPSLADAAKAPAIWGTATLMMVVSRITTKVARDRIKTAATSETPVICSEPTSGSALTAAARDAWSTGRFAKEVVGLGLLRVLACNKHAPAGAGDFAVSGCP